MYVGLLGILTGIVILLVILGSVILYHLWKESGDGDVATEEFRHSSPRPVTYYVGNSNAGGGGGGGGNSFYHSSGASGYISFGSGGSGPLKSQDEVAIEEARSKGYEEGYRAGYTDAYEETEDAT